MPRVAKEIKCNENDISSLISIVQNPLSDPHLAIKATALLLCIDGMANTDVASKLGVRKNTIGDWRNAYIENGIEGLRGKKRPGRRGSNGPDMRELVKEKLKEKPEDGEKWTAKALSDAVGTSVDTVRRALREEGISLERKTRWSIPTEIISAPAAIGIAGLYLSDAGKAVVIYTSREEKMDLSHGSITTRSASHASDLQEMLSEDGYVPIADALEILSRSNAAMGKCLHKGIGMQEYLNGIGRSMEGREGFTLHGIILQGKGVEAPSLSCVGLSVTMASDFDSWLTLISQWIGPLCGNEGGRIRSALSRYTDEYMKGREPLIWNAGAANLYQEMRPSETSETSGQHGGLFSDPSVRNVLRVSATILARDGKEIHREVELPNGVPGLEEIHYESPLTLGASIGRLERAVSDGMSDVAKRLCEGYMDLALKKTECQEKR